MGNKPASSQSPVMYRGIPPCSQLPVTYGDKLRVKRIGNGVLPRDLARIVREYLSDSSGNYAETALVGVQSITLRLSQDMKSLLGSFLELGFLPPEHHWTPNKAWVDMEFLIDDLKGDPARFFDGDLGCCSLVIDVLVVQLSMAVRFSSNALGGLRKAITVLQEQLKTVNHVVISITEYAACCFSFKDVIDTKAMGRQPIDPSKALLEIIDDLSACWKKSLLTADSLFAFYFKNKIKPASEIYLVKFVLVLNHPPHLALLKKQAFNAVSNKLMWVCSLRSEADFRAIPQTTPQLWRAIYCEVPGFHESAAQRRFLQYWKPDFRSETSSFVERIHSRAGIFGGEIELFQPRAPFVHVGLHSALIELSLFGKNYSFHLTQLNTGYFPNLTILTLVDVKITGHLDSHSVPHLKELRIEFEHHNSKSLSFWNPILSEHRQSIINAGRPWQFVTTKRQGGWSFASYDEPTSNLQDDVKEGSPHSLPLIRELLLVMRNQEHADEWQSQLNGVPSVEAAAADDHNDRLLVWAPECVQSITMLGETEKKFKFDFRKTTPKETPILTSLYSRNVRFALSGSLFPHLQSFKVDSCDVKLSGAFPDLQTLTFMGGCLESRWQVNAPLLQSVHCEELTRCSNLSFQPQLLPHLSSLCLVTTSYEPQCYPKVILDEDGVGFSHLKYARLGGWYLEYSFFNRGLVESVPHLELRMDARRLPEFWFDTAWLCEEFCVCIYVPPNDKMPPPPIVVLPPLSRVKKLMVTEEHCQVLLNREMLNLIECTVESPRMLGPNLKCPALQRIRFTGELSESDKEKCLDPATYAAIGARPREVIFAFHYQLHTMA